MDRPLTTALGWRIPPRLLDVGPVAFIALEGTVAIFFRPKGVLSTGLLALALIVVTIALLLRHRAPLLVLGTILAVLFALNYGPLSILPALLAVFTVAEYTDRSTVIAAAAIAGVVVVATPLVHGLAEPPPAVLSRLIAVGLAVAVGLWLRARADYVTGLRDRAERLEREQALQAQQAVADERVRIARELHDVVAHNVSLMVVQAQALAATGDDGPERDAALGRVANLGREALSEMHRMLGVLRLENGDAAEREPQPGVGELEDLLARTRQAGLEASLSIRGSAHELPPGVDLSAFRIVQEALTNVIRHAQATSAAVTLTYSSDAIEVSVVDDGVGPGPGRSNGSGGHGLVGMRERVALFGGELSAGSGPDGRGYRLRAILPIR